MKSTHRLFHVIITGSTFVMGCGGGALPSQEPTDIAAPAADGHAAKLDKAHGSRPAGDATKNATLEPRDQTAHANSVPKSKQGSANQEEGRTKGTTPRARMGVPGW